MIRLANNKNLINGRATQFRSGEEAARNGKKGGIASGISRREKKTFRELTELVLSAKTNNEELKEFAAMFGIGEPDNKLLVVLGMVKAAIGGNHNAFDRLYELSGEKTETMSSEEEKQENLLKAIEKAVKSGNK